LNGFAAPSDPSDGGLTTGAACVPATACGHPSAEWRGSPLCHGRRGKIAERRAAHYNSRWQEPALRCPGSIHGRIRGPHTNEKHQIQRVPLRGGRQVARPRIIQNPVSCHKRPGSNQHAPQRPLGPIAALIAVDLGAFKAHDRLVRQHPPRSESSGKKNKARTLRASTPPPSWAKDNPR